jgi:hypothetical protein
MFADDLRATKLAAQNAESELLRIYEEFKAHRAEVRRLQHQFISERQRNWLPALVAVLAAMFSFACAVFARH